MRTTCLIIDDEPLAINVIKSHLEQINDFEIVNTFTNAIDALNFLKDNTVDLIFLDINMPLLDGISFIKSLEEKPLIIITSAHTEFAVEAYDLDLLDYLLKPISFSRFHKAINKARKLKSNQQLVSKVFPERPFIFVKIDKKKMKKIYLDEILVIESLKDYLKISTTTNRYIIHQTLISFTEELPPNKFIRIHRSYTIAVDKIDTIEGNSLEIGGIRYPIGRTYNEHVKDRILNSQIASRDNK